MLSPGSAEMSLEAPLAAFADAGFARLGRVMSDEALAALRDRSDALMLGQVSYPGLFFQRDADSGRYGDLTFGRGYEGPSLDYRKVEKLEKDPRFLAWIENPLFARIAREVIVGDVAIYRAVLFNKPARGGTVLPWHQDGGAFWGLDRSPTLQIWTALDDCPEDAGCLAIVPGTHKDGLATPLGGMIPEEIVAAKRADERRVLVPARAGEAVLIHNHVWHGSGVNRVGRPRRAVTICYMSAETRCLRKKRAPRSFVRVFAER